MEERRGEGRGRGEKGEGGVVERGGGEGGRRCGICGGVPYLVGVAVPSSWTLVASRGPERRLTACLSPAGAEEKQSDHLHWVVRWIEMKETQGESSDDKNS